MSEGKRSFQVACDQLVDIVIGTQLPANQTTQILWGELRDVVARLVVQPLLIQPAAPAPEVSPESGNRDGSAGPTIDEGGRDG